MSLHHPLVATAPAPPGEVEDGSLSDRQVRRRIGAIWALLFFNGMTWLKVDTVIPIPKRLGQSLTMGALAAALVIALTLNRRLRIRPNVVLSLYTVLAAVALISTIKGASTVGPYLRVGRLAAFIAVLWLLTPWWGRGDLLLARCHLRTLIAVSATVVLGLLVAPSHALAINGRLAGVFWPIWPTAVAHFAAVAAGMAVVLWLSERSTSGRFALVVGAGGLALVFLSQTRIALVALVAGVLCAGLSLLLARRRVRRVASFALVAAPVVLIALAPFFVTWFARGQSAADIAALSGRTYVWERLLNEPRSEFTQWFGSGLSDKGFEGLPIDSTWLATYQDEGLLGVGILAAILLFLLISTAFHGATVARALGLFLIVYCAVDSYTEVGLTDASSYMLDVIAAASLLAPGARAPDDG